MFQEINRDWILGRINRQKGYVDKKRIFCETLPSVKVRKRLRQGRRTLRWSLKFEIELVVEVGLSKELTTSEKE